MRILQAVVVLACVAHGAEYTSVRTGAWNEATTWSPQGVPGEGDRIVIAKSHVVTIPAGYTARIGDSPANNEGPPAIRCSSSGGHGVLDIRGELVFSGPVEQCNAAWTVGPGASVVHDSSKASDPATASYVWRTGMEFGMKDSRLLVQGTPQARSTFRIAPGSGNAGGFDGGPGHPQDTGLVQAKYADFQNWGTAATFFLRCWPFSGGTEVSFDHCRIDRSGAIDLVGFRPNVTFKIVNTVITNPILSKNRGISMGYGAYLTATPEGGDRRIEDSYIEGPVSMTVNSNMMGKDAGFVIRRTILAGGTRPGQAPFLQANNPAFAPGNWDLVWLNNRIQSSSDSGLLPAGTLQRTILTRNWHINPHWVYLATRDTLIDGWIAETENDNGVEGDILMLVYGRTPYRAVVRNGITVPTPGGQAPGVTINYSTASACDDVKIFCPEVIAEHNTYLGDAKGLTAIGGESNPGHANMFRSIQKNIVWRTTPGEGYITKWHIARDPVDNTYVQADQNVWWNFTNEMRYDRLDKHPQTYSNPPGLRDVHADPQFVEVRNILQWGRKLKPEIARWADIQAEFQKICQGDYDKRFNLEDMYDWIREGYQTRNPAVEGYGANSTMPGEAEMRGHPKATPRFSSTTK